MFWAEMRGELKSLVQTLTHTPFRSDEWDINDTFWVGEVDPLKFCGWTIEVFYIQIRHLMSQLKLENPEFHFDIRDFIWQSLVDKGSGETSHQDLCKTVPNVLF